MAFGPSGNAYHSGQGAAREWLRLPACAFLNPLPSCTSKQSSLRICFRRQSGCPAVKVWPSVISAASRLGNRQPAAPELSTPWTRTAFSSTQIIAEQEETCTAKTILAPVWAFPMLVKMHVSPHIFRLFLASWFVMTTCAVSMHPALGWPERGFDEPAFLCTCSKTVLLSGMH